MYSQMEKTFPGNRQRHLSSADSLIKAGGASFSTVQKQAAKEEEETIQGRFAVQLQSPDEEELPVQGKFTMQKEALPEEEPGKMPVQGKFTSLQKKDDVNQGTTNRTGLPDNLKAGIENLSGTDMNDVKVYYNSDKPFQLNALAYAQGTDIHIGPGQEQHLPHEAWHIAQQKQGRVQPTTQMKEGVAVNDDPLLEKEADVMGAKAGRVTQRKINPAGKNVVQLKGAKWELRIGVKSLIGTNVEAKVILDYDDVTGILVRDVKSQLKNYKGGIYTVKLIYLGTNTAMDGNLRNDDYNIPEDSIRLNSSKFVGVLQEVESEIEHEKISGEKVPRPGFVVTISQLQKIIELFGFKKIVTGNHIDGARDTKSDAIDRAVISQQVNEIAGNTLFIDPLFKSPGVEGQYHDHIYKNGGKVVYNMDGLCVISDNSGSFLLGILSKGVYTDEAEELGVSVSHHIKQVRPIDIIKE